MSNSASKGFTLIELLVVIAIIGLLSSIILAALNAARSKANDTTRVTELKSVQQALEIYADDNSGHYPVSVNSAGTSKQWDSDCSSWGDEDGLIPGLTPTDIASIPQDPQSNGVSKCCFMYISDGTNYDFVDHDCAVANTSNPTLESLIDPYFNGVNSPIVDWSVYTNGAVVNGTLR